MLLSLKGNFPPAVLALADGTILRGHSIGASGQTVGEVVFNTSMTGYQEILTDPSYFRQIVTLTCPHIGNTGVNDQDSESGCVRAAGLVVRELSMTTSSFRATGDLASFLKDSGTVAIAGLDTRALTCHIRDHGAQNGCILTLPEGTEITEALIQHAIDTARAAPRMTGLDLAREVSTPQAIEWTQTEWRLVAAQGKPGFGEQITPRFHVVAYDFGIKRNILRKLAQRGARVTLVPAQTPAADVFRLQPDGVFLSNGPGDPQPCDYAIAATRDILAAGIPVFGICLGYQIMALAAGAQTFKMKAGHHGANHPVKNVDTGHVSITSQNHGFAVDEKTLPDNLRVTHVSLFDGTLQGLELTDRPAFGFQGHPEALPGPNDVAVLFDRFTQLMQQRQQSMQAPAITTTDF